MRLALLVLACAVALPAPWGRAVTPSDAAEAVAMGRAAADRAGSSRTAAPPARPRVPPSVVPVRSGPPVVRPSLAAPPRRAGGLEVAGSGWSGVGLVRVGASKSCTGALVRADVVLTAAHCVFGEDGVAVEPGRIRFLAGWRDGRAVASARVAEAVVPPGYARGPSALGGRVPDDLALLRLEAPIRDRRVRLLALGGDPEAGDRVSVVSYGAGRMGAPSLESDCGVTRSRGGLVGTDCDGVPGASGAPILAARRGRPTIVAVISGGSSDGSTLAAGSGAVAELLARVGPESEPSERHGARGLGGAKFVRP